MSSTHHIEDGDKHLHFNSVVLFLCLSCWCCLLYALQFAFWAIEEMVSSWVTFFFGGGEENASTILLSNRNTLNKAPKSPPPSAQILSLNLSRNFFVEFLSHRSDISTSIWTKRIVKIFRIFVISVLFRRFVSFDIDPLWEVYATRRPLIFFTAFVPCASGSITRVSLVLFPNFT